ncbi:MAG: M14/M99 family metallopeptidase, partial [Thioalkalispiraceae bacterium]
MYRVALLALAYFFSPMAFAQAWDFTLHKHQSEQPGPTMLVIGGIQGDEPGGFNAASLLTTNYRILRGEVWVVPNLNFESIIKRSRGVHGDMNRKFKDIPDKDPEFQLVQKIKRIIRDQQVDIILNLHDGSGFYRPQYIDRMHSPYRWGQSLIIDQATLENVPYGQLRKIADTITNQTNTRLSNLEHRFHVKNTKTREGNREMEKTLTYYAIQNGKAAFGLEASKSFDTHYRAYYHLQLIESFMQYLGIEYQREFNLTINQVKDRIDNNIKVALYQKKMLFDM